MWRNSSRKTRPVTLEYWYFTIRCRKLRRFFCLFINIFMGHWKLLSGQPCDKLITTDIAIIIFSRWSTFLLPLGLRLVYILFYFSAKMPAELKITSLDSAEQRQHRM